MRIIILDPIIITRTDLARDLEHIRAYCECKLSRKIPEIMAVTPLLF